MYLIPRLELSLFSIIMDRQIQVLLATALSLQTLQDPAGYVVAKAFPSKTPVRETDCENGSILALWLTL